MHRPSPPRRARRPAVTLVAVALIGLGFGDGLAPQTTATQASTVSARLPLTSAVPAATAFNPAAVTIGLNPVASGFSKPVLVTNAGDGRER